MQVVIRLQAALKWGARSADSDSDALRYSEALSLLTAAAASAGRNIDKPLITNAERPARPVVRHPSPANLARHFVPIARLFALTETSYSPPDAQTLP
jgi:hypothetical protein